MIRFNKKDRLVDISFSLKSLQPVRSLFEKRGLWLLIGLLTIISCASFVYYLHNGLGLAYNDARSHLDIGRRVVENLKPGFAQLGSVWLPLPHLLMVPTIWNDFMWHSGLAGALQSMISFVMTAVIIYLFLRELNVPIIGRLVGVFVFVANINTLYLQSTAMTELLLLGTMTAGAYQLLLWFKKDRLIDLIGAGFWIMLSTLNRYDGWFMLLFALALIMYKTYRKQGRKTAEGMGIFFVTLAGFGIGLWFLWNLLIFKDPLYFALGPYSAHAQQQQLADAGDLATKGNLWLSLKVYFYALAYNSGAFTLVLGLVGAAVLWLDKKLSHDEKLATITLWAPFVFNVLALFLGFSVLFVQGISGTSWFNVRYGILMLPSIAVFVGYLIGRVSSLRLALLGLILFVTFFTFTSGDAVTIDDAVVGASGKNVTEVSGWLRQNAGQTNGFVLISVASHDAIIFSSGLPMSRFIHEGTGVYWDSATKDPVHWARYIIMRTHDTSDQTFKALEFNKEFINDYTLVHSYPFADIYEIKPQYLSGLQTKPVLAQKEE